MLSLADALPRSRFSELFDVVDEECLAADVPGYLATDPDGAAIVCLYVWDEMVHRGLVSDPQAMAKFYPGPIGGVYSLVGRVLGTEPFKDAYAAEFYNEHSNQLFFGRPAHFAFAEFEMVQCFPNDIHIADVTLLDLTRPVQENGAGAPRSHHGLHVFPQFLDGLKRVAGDRGATRISLVAASPAAAKTFSSYGFVPSEAPASAYAVRHVGHGHAMVLDLTHG